MEKLKVAIFLLVISILAAISLFESYFERGYIGALIAALFILLLVFIVIYILLDDIQFKKFNLKKERKIKKYGVIKDVLKNNTVGGYNVVVSYTIKNKNYQTKSESLFFNPLPLIKEFNIKEIPIYILVNSNKVLIDIDYFSYYMEEKNNQAKYLFNISNKNKFHKNDFFNYLFGGYYLGILGIICGIGTIIVNLCFKVGNNIMNIARSLIILGSILIIANRIFLNNKGIKKRGIALIGHVETINKVYNKRHSFDIIVVSYVYKNKIYMGKSIPIYFETLNDLEFIPVYILPNNPKKCYVDVSVLNNEGGI